MHLQLSIVQIIHVTILCIICAGAARTQDLSQIGKRPAFNWSGGINAYTGFYSTDLNDPKQVPLTWGISGNLNLSIYDVQIPLSFLFSERERSFRQPFNQYGLSPSYKWIKVHIGYRSMNFSQLTLGNHRFFGGGLELTPGKVQVAAMYGLLREEVVADTTLDTRVETGFDRVGMGLKLGFGKLADKVDLILFRAEDKFNSIDLENGVYGRAQPEENLVAGLNVNRKFLKFLQLQVESAVSLHNIGLIPETRTGDLAEIANDYDSFLFNIDPSTRRGTAVKAGLSFNRKGFTVSANYDRISPFFRTLGNYYFMNDQENIRGQVGFSLAKRKVRMMLSMGIQRNDLARVDLFRTTRTIGSGSINYNSGKAYTAMVNYSNFEADMRSAIETYGSDSIQFTQVSQNLILNQTVRYSNKETGMSDQFSLATTYQSFVNSGTEQIENGTSSITGSFSYRHGNKEKNASYGVRATFTTLEYLGIPKKKYGLALNGGRKFFNENFGVNSRLAFYLNRSETTPDNASLIFSIGLDQRVLQAHRFGVNISYNSRGATTLEELQQYQVRGRITYSLQLKPKKRSSQSNNPSK